MTRVGCNSGVGWKRRPIDVDGGQVGQKLSEIHSHHHSSDTICYFLMDKPNFNSTPNSIGATYCILFHRAVNQQQPRSRGSYEGRTHMEKSFDVSAP